ncbi:MAG: DNA primase [Bacteroidetes bacterium]|nr:DNA primase [Bacteroidota bacterium]
MIHKEDIDKIFEAARVEEVVADYVSLKKRGANLIGCCPFHNEKTPSFYVSPAKGIYKCFGCGKGGNAINFIMDHDKMTYPDALRFLAKKYNIEIKEEEQTPEQIQHNNDRESLLVVSSFAQKHFSENLYNTDEGKSIGLGYFKERGLREDIIQKFQLGYSINQRNAFTEIAVATGYKMEYLVKSGLTIEYKNEAEINAETGEIIKPEETKHLDRFWGRVMFPIHNQSGRVIAFGGRTLRTDAKTSKYVNSPETEIYHKSDVLYGLYHSKNAIIKEKFCFLVEGYMDVIAMHQAGVENVVASSGTALTAGQIKSIERFTKDVIISYDGDKAGIEAAIKGINLLLEEGLNVKVLLFPDGDDPDSYSKKVSTQELKDFIVNNAQNFISYIASIEASKNPNNDPLKKAEAIKKIVNTIALVPDAIYRSIYVKECSRIMEVDEQILLSELNKIRSKNFNDKRGQPTQQQQHSELEELILPEKKEHSIADAEHQERDIIRLLINYGGEHVTIDSQDEAGEDIQVEVSVAYLLVHELQSDNIVIDNLLYNSVFNEFAQHLEKDVVPDTNYFISHENAAICSLTIDLISSPYTLSNWEQHGIYPTQESSVLKRSIYNAIYALKSRKIEMMIHDNQKRLKENPPEEEMLTLMQTQQSLLEAKKVFNNMLGRIVVK